MTTPPEGTLVEPDGVRRREMSRRAFAGSLTSLLVGAGVGGCAAPGDGETTVPGAAAITRPLLRPWAGDLVWMAAEVEELPVAYVSMARRQVFVDSDYRDRASWLLDAHISVSTWHWRIPLPGDPPGQPITPGDSAREFEERGIREWDSSTPPAMDDIRIVRGRPSVRRVNFSCVPLTGVRVVDDPASGAPMEVWYSAGPWSLEMARADDADTLREDFAVVGMGQRFVDRACMGAGDAVQIVSWAHRAR